MMLSARIAAVEFDDQEVRLAVVKTGGSVPTLLECHSEPLASAEPSEREEACVAALQSLLERVKQKPSACVLVAGASDAIVRAITVPFKGNRRVSAAVRFELEPYLAFPIDDLAVDHSPIREIDGSTQVLAVGLRRAILENELACLNAAGLDAEGIGVDAVGLTALWQARRRATQGLHAVLHVRDQGSILVVLWNKSLAYMRHLPVNVAQMHENPVAAARDAQNSLRSFQTSWEGADELDGLTVTGVNFFDEERQLFEEAFRVPVTYDDLALKVKGNKAESSEGNRWETLAGAAYVAAGNCPYGYNFRQGELAPPHALSGMLRHAAFSMVIGAIALLGYGAYMYLNYQENEAVVEAAGTEIWDILRDTFPESEAANAGRSGTDVGGELAFGALQSEMENAGLGGRGLSLELFKQPTPLDILTEVARVMPGDQVTLTLVQMQPQQTARVPRVTIDGVADNPEVFNKFFQALSQSKILKVEPNPTSESQGSKLEFTINATLEENTGAQG
ncbi:MAG: pilus assembly protein PilM [FCB group bacterium]|jgi:hypothetical protein|nr:pilus assembly protein PilM [FCB group bacterium]